MLRLVALCCLVSLAFSAQYQIINGVGTPGDAYSMLSVYPRLPSTTFTICEGDSILFTVQSELHSVTFPASAASILFSGNPFADPTYVWMNPLVLPYSNGQPVLFAPGNTLLQLDVYEGSREVADGGNASLPSSSGLMFPLAYPGGFETNVTFHDPGRYTYSDIAHANGGVIVVVDAANCATDSSILTPAAALTAMNDQIDTDLASIPTTVTPNVWTNQIKGDARMWDSNNKRWIMTAGFVGSTGVAAFQRFMPENLVIELGDKVLMINQFPGHAHTFNVNTTATPPVQFEFDPFHVPPTLRLSREAFLPSAATLAHFNAMKQNVVAYTGVQGPGASQLATFVEAGNYAVVCEFHATIGMVGSIKVVDSCAQCYANCPDLYTKCRASLEAGAIPDPSYTCTSAEVKAAQKCNPKAALPPRSGAAATSTSSASGVVATAVAALVAAAMAL